MRPSADIPSSRMHHQGSRRHAPAPPNVDTEFQIPAALGTINRTVL
jgi:hypothetical protein